MPLARHFALLFCAAALASCAPTRADAPPTPDSRMGMVVAAMMKQAEQLDNDGQPQQATLTRRLAHQLESGAFGSDPVAALTAATANQELAADKAAYASPSPPELQSAPASQKPPLGFPQGGVVAGNRDDAAIGPSSVSANPGNSSLPVQALAGRLAVLDLRNYASDLTAQNATYFTDLIRQETLRTQPRLQVITRENLLVLLQASGKKIEECEGECEVDTGRRIGADLIVSGEIQKLGTRYKISIRLHDTKEGRLLGSAIASGTSIDALDDAAAKAVKELYSTAH